MIVAIFVFAPLGLPAWYLLVASRILGVPLIAGLSFEVIKFAGRNRRKRWVRGVMWPGMQLQKLTTREPDLDQLAVAIAALEAVLAVEDPRNASAEDTVGHGGRRLDARPRVHDRVARRADRGALPEAQAQMSDPEVIGDRQRYAEAGRALQPARARREARRGVAAARVATPRARRSCSPRAARTPELRAELERRARADRASSRRRSGSRWSSATPTTTRT